VQSCWMDMKLVRQVPCAVYCDWLPPLACISYHTT